MIEWIKSKIHVITDPADEREYEACILDLIQNEVAYSMENFTQHSNISCLEHCLYVSYSSYKVCKKLGLDYRSAARGGLLHDLFLYDWHVTKPQEGLHGFVHPYIALRNANKHFDLNNREQDIIVKHMWPLTLVFPKYRESFVVAMVDKYCASMEIVKFQNRRKVMKLKELFEA
jgi:hypothetical protein